jgi:Flp pilus assembly protein TadG
MSANAFQGNAAIARCRRLLRREEGMAAVEFALILPILVVLWIGGVEVTQALSVDRRLNNLASALGDLVARSKVITHAQVDDIFDIAPGAMFPYCKTEAECAAEGLTMRITAVTMNSAGDAKATWSRAQGTTGYAANADLNSVVPATLRVADTQIIMAEVAYVYTPAVGYVVSGSLTLNDRMFFVPRLAAKVKLCQSVNPETNCTT